MPSLFNVPELLLEEWRDVKGFEGIYKVSNQGRVKSLDRVTSDGKNVRGKLLTPSGYRYSAAELWKEGKGSNKLIHRLVAEAFVPNPNNFPEVNHIDSDVSNNNAFNLEWVTSSDNHKQSIKNRSSSYSYRKEVKCLETGQIFPSILAAGSSVNSDATQIIESIDRKSCCKGLTFVYAEEVPSDIHSYITAAHSKYQDFHKRPVMKNSKEVQVIETGQIFDSIVSAARFF